MASLLEGTITKHKRKINLLNDFIQAIENGNNSIITTTGHIVYSEYEEWAKNNDEVIRKSNFLPNLDENNKIISYSFPTYGYALVNENAVNGEVTVNLLKTYNRFYFGIDLSQSDVLNFTFKSIGLQNENLNKTGLVSTNYNPYISIGVITQETLNENKKSIEELLNNTNKSIPFDRFFDTSSEAYDGEKIGIVADLRELNTLEKYCYIIITNMESGDVLENPNFDPNKEDVSKAFYPYFTCSAPDLIDIQSTVFNRAPTIPENIGLYHNGDATLYPKIPETDLIEGVESRLEWTPSIDLDETPELDTLNMGKFTLPVGLSRGDINKDGKIDEEDLSKLKKILAGEENFNEDGYGLWAATISEFGSDNNTGVNETGKNILSNHLDPKSEIQIKSEVYKGMNWESIWEVDITNNLYYIDIEDKRITPEVKIELYNEYLYNLGTLKEIQCNEGSFRIYASCCPTGGLFTQENYDGENVGALLKEKWEKLKEEEFLQIEYKIVAEPYKQNILRKFKDENISYELIIEYDNEDIEKYWIFPKDKDYLDIPFIQDLYYEYSKTYLEREEKENLNKFLKLLPKKTLVGYELNKEGKLYAILPAISEEEQFIQNAYMFKTKIKQLKMASIDYYGMKSLYIDQMPSNINIHYLNNTAPSVPSKVIFQQNKNNITLTGTGVIDKDTNIGYKNPSKDLIRYEYQYFDESKKEYININSIKSISLPNSLEPGLGDFTRQGKIDDFSLIRLSAYISGQYIPIHDELKTFADLTGNKQIDQGDIDLIKKYINNKEHIIFPGLKDYEYNQLEEYNWEKDSNKGMYKTSIEVELPDEISPFTLYLYNSYLFDLQTFVESKIIRNGKTAKIDLYFKVPLTQIITLNYSVQINNYGNEVKLYKHTQWYPTPLIFTISKRPDEAKDILVRARATDRMVWSDWKEFKDISYPDIWLGVRNFLGGGSGVSGAVKNLMKLEEKI